MSDDDKEEGTIALIHQSWFTPQKNQVWWPPYKTSAQFKKALVLKEQINEDTWLLYNVKRILFSCDDWNKANKKLKACEELSDIHSTEVEDETQNKKRKRTPNSKYMNTNIYGSSEDEDTENCDLLQLPSQLYKPMYLKDKQSKKQSQQKYVEKDRVLQEIPINAFASCSKDALRSVPINDIGDNISNSRLIQKSCGSSANCIVEQNCTFRDIPAMSYKNNACTTSTTFPTTTIDKNVTHVNQSCGNTCMRTYEHIFTEIKKLREQVKEVYGILKHSHTAENGVPTCDDISVEFPLNTHEDLQELETYLKSRQNRNDLSLHLSTLGGDTTATRTNRILRHVFTNELAKDFNYVGQKNAKQAFAKLYLKTVVIRSVQIKSPSTTESDIQKAIQIWLKHAPERLKASLKKKGDNSAL